MEEEVYDVIVIGAGFSGISAALTLSLAGKKVLILEARDRIGGRAYTGRASDGHTFEYGATWVGPTQDEVNALIQKYEIPLKQTFEGGDSVNLIEGKRKTYTGTIPPFGILGLVDISYSLLKLESVSKKIPVEEPWTANDAEWYDSITFDNYLKNHMIWTSTIRNAVSIAIRVLLCAEPNEVSALFGLWFIHSNQGFTRLTDANNGAQQDHIEGGTTRILDCMLNEIKENNGQILLETPITAIDDKDDIVLVHSQTRESFKTYRAKYCICTIPPPLVPQVEFSPPLPPEYISLRQRMPLGSIIKTIIRYPTPFWRDLGYCGSTISDEGPVVASYDYCDMENNFYALIGFVNGQECVKYRHLSQEERKGIVSEYYRNIFQSDEALEPSEYWDIDWTTERYSRGCYLSVMPTGTLTKFGECLRKNHGKIYFATTESATKWFGYMDGAIQSGRVNAEKIIELLNNK